MKLKNEEDLLLALLKPEDSAFEDRVSSITNRGIDWNEFYESLKFVFSNLIINLFIGPTLVLTHFKIGKFIGL